MPDTKDSYKVLILEDNINDSNLIKIELSNNIDADLVFMVVNSKNDFINALNGFIPDIVISDFNLPQFNGFEALAITIEHDKNLPFIISTGSLTEEHAADSIKLGAWDYVVKERLHRLPSAFVNAMKIKKERINTLQIEKDLRDSQMFVQNLAQASPVGIFRTKVDGCVTYVNPKWSELTGLKPADSMDLNWTSALHHEDKEKLKGLFDKLSSAVELRFLKSDGDVVWVIANTVPEIIDGKTKGYIGTITDITKIKNIESEIINEKERAEASDKLKTAFMNNISHEIRTPLNGILGFSSLLFEPGITDDDRKSYFEIVESSSKRLIKTITDYMDISLITSCSVSVNNTMFKLNDLLDEIYNLNKPLFEKKGLEFEFNISSHLKSINIDVDRELLSKVFQHLIDNALKFTQKGKVILGGEMKKDSIELYVKDTGVGISKDVLAIIFDDFIQEDSSSSRGYEGSGLGLAIVKGFIKILGGSIKVDSKKRVGSTFTFTIPCNKEPVNAFEEKKFGMIENSVPVILIAEDDDFNYFYLRTILKNYFELIHAKDGGEVLELFHANPHIQLILMDIKMPVLNGIEVTQKIRETNKDIPIIAVTAYAQKGDYERCIHSGCNEYVTKPIQRELLFDTIKKLGITVKNKNES